MFRKLVLVLTGLGALAVAAVFVLTNPLLRRLPKQRRVSMDGITTMNDVAEACRRMHLQGWDLVAWHTRSTWQPGNSPTRVSLPGIPLRGRALERGMGYCEQLALALKQIYDRLGIETRPVSALRCAFPAWRVDGMPSPGGSRGHAWLRVGVAGEERDVCPGSPSNTPGVTQFQKVSQVRTWHPWLRPFTQVGSSIETIRRDMVASSNSKRTGSAKPLALEA